jgi:hypothetical protein
VKVEAEMEKTGSGSFLSPDASAGIGMGSAWASGFASTAAVGMKGFGAAPAILKGAGIGAGVAGAIVTGMETYYKVKNDTHNTSDWVNLAITTGFVAAGVCVTAPAWIIGTAVVGFGYGIYRAAGGDAWIDRYWGYR